VPGVTFKMLMKRGGKDDRTKELHVSWGQLSKAERPRAW
jgi:hypothetical protein